MPHNDGIYQGDFIGYGGSDTHTPNTITYKFDNVIDDIIVATHTQYIGATIQELDAKKQEAIANLNALHGAKQQCDSFLKELHDDDQTASAVAGS